jgi:hypothetical protein
MKDPLEVLRRKEDELRKLQEEVEALRLMGKLLKEHKQSTEKSQGGKVILMSEIHLA